MQGSSLASNGLRSEPLVNLARSLASLHAARDLKELAGHIEQVGERCIDAVLTALLLADDCGEFRLVEGSLRRPVTAESVRRDLRVERVAQNENVLAAARQALGALTTQWNDSDQLFDGPTDLVVGTRSAIAPISHGGEAQGVVVMITQQTEESALRISLLAEHAGIAIARLRELERARRLHGIDEELWIADENALRDSLTRELNRARRYGGSVGVTLIRIDCMDELRVRYGTFYASQFVRRIGRRLGATVRDTDILGAVEGAFAVIHPATARDGISIAADRLLDEVGLLLSSAYPELELSLIAQISSHSVVSPDDGTTAGELIGRLVGRSLAADGLDNVLAA